MADANPGTSQQIADAIGYVDKGGIGMGGRGSGSAGNGDTVTIQDNAVTYNVDGDVANDSTLTPTPGVTIVGSSAAACSVRARLDADMAGSANPLTLEDFSMDLSGLTQINQAPAQWTEGTFYNRRLAIAGLNSTGDLVEVRSFNNPAVSHWWDCIMQNSAGDVFATEGANAEGPASKTNLYHCRLSGAADGSQNQIVSAHNDHAIRMFGGSVDDSSRSGTEGCMTPGAGAAGPTLMQLYGVSIIGKVGSCNLFNCAVQSRTGNAALVILSQADAEILCAGTKFTQSHGATCLDVRGNAVVRLESCWLIGTGVPPDSEAVKTVSGPNTSNITLFNNRFQDWQFGINLDHSSGSPTIDIVNNAFDNTVRYIRDSISGTGDMAAFTGNNNVMSGTQSGSRYTEDATDILDDPDFTNNLPTIGGNCEAVNADQTLSLNWTFGVFGRPRLIDMKELCVGPADIWSSLIAARRMGGML